MGIHRRILLVNPRSRSARCCCSCHNPTWRCPELPNSWVTAIGWNLLRILTVNRVCVCTDTSGIVHNSPACSYSGQTLESHRVIARIREVREGPTSCKLCQAEPELLKAELADRRIGLTCESSLGSIETHTAQDPLISSSSVSAAALQRRSRARSHHPAPPFNF